jgi:hypothetical protein
MVVIALLTGFTGLRGCATVPVSRVDDVQLVRVSNAVPGEWYAGDLHSHSLASDGDSPVETVIARAEERGLDFLSLSDHDTSMDGTLRQWHDPEYRSERMVLLHGVEWTSGNGHANVFSARPFEYDDLWRANRETDIDAAIRSAREQAAVFSVNHPSGRARQWTYPFTNSDGAFVADTMEVWNGPFNFPNRNRRTVRVIWDDLLATGIRVNAIGGSDSHQTAGIQSRVNLYGAPTTWVYATGRSGESIVEAIRSGHVSLSYQPYGDRLELLADSDGDGKFEAMMGDVIPAGSRTTFAVAVMGPFRKENGLGRGPRYQCIVFKNGEVHRRIQLQSWRGEGVMFTDTPSAGDYYRAELRGAPAVGILQRPVLGRTLALTNPIYVR